MFCAKCGNELPDNVKICTKCGAEVKIKKPAADKKTGGESIIIIMVIVAVIIALLAGFFVVSKLYKDGKIDWKIMESIYGDRDDAEEEDADDEEDIDEVNNSDVDDVNTEGDENDTASDNVTAAAFKGVKIKDWCDSYASYIRNLPDGYTYNLIDVNGDSVYELVCEGADEATGCLILTCNKNGIAELQTARLSFSYIEGGNLLNNSGGHMGYYYDYIYRIGENGSWESVDNGEYVSPNGYDMYDDYGNMILEYSWNGAKTTREGYFSQLNAAYPDENACILPKYNSKDEMLQILESYKPVLGETSPIHRPEDGQIHSYELVVGDVSWYEAYEDCANKGGYLVNINSKEEYEHIIGLIKSKNLEDKIFFIGAIKNYITGGYNWDPGYKKDENIFYSSRNDCIDTNPKYKEFWLTGEPSYIDDSGDYPVEENVVDMFYSKTANKFVWNDVPHDILSAVPYYSGKIAYIIEYDK